MATESKSMQHGTGIVQVIFGLAQLWFAVMALILAAAFILGLLGANPDTGFSSWIFARTATLMTPFNGLFAPITFPGGGTVIRTSLLFAILVYVVIASMLGAVSRWISTL